MDDESGSEGENTPDLPLSGILDTFNDSISEEQAWGLCFQCASSLSSSRRSDGHWRRIEAFSDIIVCSDGTVRVETGSESVIECTESLLTQSLGILIYKALDYGQSANEQKSIERTLEQMLDQMTSYEDELHNSDEGYEEEESIECNRVTLNKIIERCCQRLSDPREAQYHYKAVCRALVAEARELRAFLEKVATSETIFQIQESVESIRLEELQRADWARLWMQVVRELRDGVKLKKVAEEEKARGPIEYELTPFEILLDDIRTKRYRLKEVPREERLSAKLKKDAHSFILDYIRSRPPLKPALRRKLRPRPSHRSLYDRLMDEIRQPPSLQHVPEPETRPMKPQKKKITVDLYDEDTDDDFGFTASLDGCDIERRRHVIPLPATPLITSQQTEALDLAHVQTPVWSPNGRRLSLNLNDEDDDDEKVSSHFSSPSRSPHRHLTAGGFDYFLTVDELIRHTLNHSTTTLSLTIDELIHIRHVLTKAEIEYLLFDPNLYDDVRRGKICFACRKTRFGLIGPRATICKLCQQKICKKCTLKMRLPHENFAQVPVSAISPSCLSPLKKPSSHASSGGSSPNSPTLVMQPVEQLAIPNFRSAKLDRLQQRIEEAEQEKARMPLVDICSDCKALLLHVIQVNRQAQLEFAGQRAPFDGGVDHHRLHQNQNQRSGTISGSGGSSCCGSSSGGGSGGAVVVDDRGLSAILAMAESMRSNEDLARKKAGLKLDLTPVYNNNNDNDH